MKRMVMMTAVFIAMVLMLPVISHADIYMDTDIDELNSSYYLQPGRAYYFPLMHSGYQVEQGENTGYSYRVTVEPRSNGVSASIVSENGLQWVRVSLSPTAGQNDPYTDIILTVTDRSDKDNKWDDPYNFEIGYGDTYYCSSDELDIFTDQTVIEFGDNVTTCRLYLPDGSELIVSLLPNTAANKNAGLGRIIDFHSTNDMIYEVETRYGGNALLEYLRFFSNATFDQSLLRIFAPGQEYAYSVNLNNSLTRLPATRNGDFLVVTVTSLGSYVTSDRDLGVPYAAGSGNENSSVIPPPAIDPPAPTPGGGSYPPATGGSSDYKVNPGTGSLA